MGHGFFARQIPEESLLKLWSLWQEIKPPLDTLERSLHVVLWRFGCFGKQTKFCVCVGKSFQMLKTKHTLPKTKIAMENPPF